MAGDRLIMLGTKGGPRLTTGSSWPTSMVLEVAGRPYIIDAGMGVTRQFVEAGYTLQQVHTIILTHHHSDHNLELGPLLHTVWVSSRFREIRVYGPPGLFNLVEKFLASQSFDIGIRISDEKLADIAEMIKPCEYTEGRVFADDLVEVTSLRVRHPPVEHCYALKFRFSGKTVVISSDTRYFPPLMEFARGADILVHEVMHREGVERMCARLSEVKPNLLQHMIASHTFGDDVGRIAEGAGVGHLVLNHFTPSDEPEIDAEAFQRLVRQTWGGELTVPCDLAEIRL
ncbi:MAG: MBL fold metallo-hydrolase [Rhodobacteraceae bacterium]|nr:MBL fold metallo-hydrolase [Paracoccaceae bacterium]